MNMFELRVPFFLPMWRRVAVTLLSFGWAILELVNGNMFWAILFGAVGATATWQFFLSGWPEKESDQGRAPDS